MSEQTRTRVETPPGVETHPKVETGTVEEYSSGETAVKGGPYLDEEKASRSEKTYSGEEARTSAEAYPHGETRARTEERLDETAASRAAARSIGEAGTTVKTGIAGSLRGIDEIESEIVSLVRNTVSNTLRATGAVGTEAASVARGRGQRCAVRDRRCGEPVLVLTTKSVAKGVVLGVSDAQAGGARHLDGHRDCESRGKWYGCRRGRHPDGGQANHRRCCRGNHRDGW